MAPLLFSIEGNIGTGKTTFIEKLKIYYKDNDRVCFLDEPIDVWNTIKDTNGVTILEKYYENQQKYAFSFQMMAFISRLASLRDVLTKDYDIIIMERSLYTDCNVFAKMLYDDKKIEDIEYAIYKKWFDEFIKDIPSISFIYLRTEPIISLKRVNIRKREGETIPLSYLENCHKYHDNWLLLKNTYSILKINANIDMQNNPEELDTLIRSVDEFIKSKYLRKNPISSLVDFAYYIQEKLF